MNKYTYLLLLVFSTMCTSEKESFPVNPAEKEKGIYSFEAGNVYFEVDANQGGRISSFKLDTQEILSGKQVNEDSWGSTFWTSPQSDWNWPPPAHIDNRSYEGKIEGNTIVLTSAKDEKFSYSVIKKFTADLSDSSVTINYTIVNNFSEKKKVAPWEVTRVIPGGLTVFPIAEDKTKKHHTPLMFDKDGVAFFEHDTKHHPGGKLKEQGAEGWMAYINGDIAFIKKFNQVSADKIAPGEGEIELNVNPDNSFMEIDEQGEYAELKSGDSLSWEVKWYFKRIPSAIKVEKGNEKLVEYIRNTVN